VAPRFFGLSAREAQALVAELQPRPEPPLRDLMTSESRQVGSTGSTDPAASLRLEFPLSSVTPQMSALPGGSPADAFSAAPIPVESFPAVPETRSVDANEDSRSILTSEFPPMQPMRVAPRPDEIEPLTASLTRLHFTVRREVVKKVEAARGALGHSIPNATLEQVLEAGLDLLLEKQAKARGQVKKPRRASAASPTELLSALQASSPLSAENQQQTQALPPTPTPTATEPPPHRRTGARAAIRAAVKRAVWVRDQGRCSWPLDRGGCCGSTHRLELDHIVPWADWGGETEANLRLTCAAHNRLAARGAFGERVMGRYSGWDRLDRHPPT
jgi:hypothetical protein